MNYKINFWNELFQALIDIHLINGNDFDGFYYIADKDAFIQLERLDYSATTPYPFLRYTFKSPEGGDVMFSVNNKEGGGMETVLDRVRDQAGVVQQLNIPNELAEQILQECYLFAVKQMATIWYN